MPPRTEWERWIEVHGEEDSVSRKIRDVRQLEDLGAEVLPALCGREQLAANGRGATADTRSAPSTV